jgi:hypothetical protein
MAQENENKISQQSQIYLLDLLLRKITAEHLIKES